MLTKTLCNPEEFGHFNFQAIKFESLYHWQLLTRKTIEIRLLMISARERSINPYQNRFFFFLFFFSFLPNGDKRVETALECLCISFWEIYCYGGVWKQDLLL